MRRSKRTTERYDYKVLNSIGTTEQDKYPLRKVATENIVRTDDKNIVRTDDDKNIVRTDDEKIVSSDDSEDIVLSNWSCVQLEDTI